MTTNQHPITPSPEQVDQWFDDAIRLNITPKYYIARQSALWSADQELEACCEWVSPFSHDDCYYEDKLRTARRPKPSSLKEQALEALEEMNEPVGVITVSRVSIIRRALEALDD
jgi:hypothetical protein